MEIATKKLKGLMLALKTGIDSGAEYTVKEWAEELNTTERQIHRTLNRLRQRHGFHQYHPVGTVRGVGGHAGVLVDINTKMEYVTETMGNQKTIYLDPQITAFSSWLESGYQKYPELRQAFKAYLSDEISKLTIMDEQLKSPSLMKKLIGR